MRHRLIPFLLCLVFLTSLRAQEREKDTLRSVFSATTFEIGRTHALDTYLSEIFYRGPGFGITNERLRLPRFGHYKIVSQQSMSIRFSSIHNSRDNGKMFSGFLDYSYGLLRKWKPIPGLQIMAGGEGEISAGFLYNIRNSNNPANAKMRINIAGTGLAAYTLRIRKTPITIRYQLTLPIIGIFFSPQYGQSYYEIFSLGNRNGIIHFGSFHNQFYMQNLLTADIPIGQNNLRLGFRNRIDTFRICDLKTRIYENEFMVGISRTFILFPGKKRHIHQPVETPF